jgi:hypothetical protein
LSRIRNRPPGAADAVESSEAQPAAGGKITIEFNDRVVRQFLIACVVWGAVGMLVGVLIALQLSYWQMNFNTPWLTWSRIRPLHTNAVIFALVGNMMFAGIYYSTQRLAKARLASDFLSKPSTFGAGSSIIVAAAITLPLGLHPRPGIRGTHLADQHRGRASSGWCLPSIFSGRWPCAATSRAFTWPSGSTSRRSSPWRCSTSSTISRFRRASRTATPHLRRRAGRAGAMVVRPQRRGLLPDHADPRHHVLLPAEGGGAAGVLLPAFGDSFLVPGLRLYLGGAAPSAEHRPAKLAADAGDDVLPDALGPLLGRHAQRPAHPARRLGQAADRPGPEVLRRRGHVLRHGHL